MASLVRTLALLGLFGGSLMLGIGLVVALVQWAASQHLAYFPVAIAITSIGVLLTITEDWKQ